tara:strand:+ start:297 stop:473 length:177 start_codon:yes stop_codon:yes gene_type:complete
MDWWLWGLLLFVILGIMGYFVWMFGSTITLWYLRKKALSIGVKKANKLLRKVTDEDDG